MTKIKGIDFVIKYGNKTLGGQRGASMSVSSDTIETTTRESNGWKEKDYGYKEWSLGTDGLLVADDECYDILEDALLNSVILDVLVDRKGTTYAGKCLITSFENDAPYDDNLSYSISIEGTGELTKTKKSIEEVKENIDETV